MAKIESTGPGASQRQVEGWGGEARAALPLCLCPTSPDAGAQHPGPKEPLSCPLGLASAILNLTDPPHTRPQRLPVLC